MVVMGWECGLEVWTLVVVGVIGEPPTTHQPLPHSITQLSTQSSMVVDGGFWKRVLPRTQSGGCERT